MYKNLRKNISEVVDDTNAYKALDNVLDLVEIIKVLKEIRKQYEKKFGIRMYANGSFEEIKEEA